MTLARSPSDYRMPGTRTQQRHQVGYTAFLERKESINKPSRDVDIVLSDLSQIFLLSSSRLRSHKATPSNMSRSMHAYHI